MLNSNITKLSRKSSTVMEITQTKLQATASLVLVIRSSSASGLERAAEKFVKWY